ncbi:DoxX family protein [Nitrosomonas sp. Nm34]|uniref:DoxX family protein n=1 Tax=Nitrosomonas sp. Nm34 TaxID=1881055 RepID=UPI0008F01B66|nr:DoxX family protein [Nitrosomonas sp. Nm34]SFJ10479.1 putative oxidoreductase [Nitrosomonas sp. Nm34]
MLTQTQLDDIGKLIVRLMVGVLILLHGLHKVLNPESLDSIRSMLTTIGLPQSIAYGVYLGEVLGGLMVALGIYSRLGGALIVGNMLFALGLAHSAQIFTLNNMGGWTVELQAFFLFSGLAIIFLGSGRLALKPD